MKTHKKNQQLFFLLKLIRFKQIFLKRMLRQCAMTTMVCLESIVDLSWFWIRYVVKPVPTHRVVWGCRLKLRSNGCVATSLSNLAFVTAAVQPSRLLFATDRRPAQPCQLCWKCRLGCRTALLLCSGKSPVLNFFCFTFIIFGMFYSPQPSETVWSEMALKWWN